MENHRHRQSEKLAETKANVSDSGVSKISRYEESNRTRRRRDVERKTKRTAQSSAPSVDILLHQNRNRFSPGAIFSCEYIIKLPEGVSLSAVESSVIWKAEGKGDEDIGVHFFERRHRATLGVNAFDSPQKLSTVLPLSPLSYDGKILKIVWQVRVRLFLADGNEFIADEPFLLSLDDTPCRFEKGEEA